MCDDDRQRVLLLRFHVDEVNVETVDRRHELRQRIESRFRFPPVVGRAPVTHQFLQRGELYALRRIGDDFLVRPASHLEPATQVVQRLSRHVDFEWPNVVSLCVGDGDFRVHRIGDSHCAALVDVSLRAWQR